MSLSTEILLQLEQKFNSIDQTDTATFRGATRDGVVPYRGQSVESVSDAAVSDSQVYPTIDDDALVFKWAYEDGLIDEKHVNNSNPDLLPYLKGEAELQELKHAYPESNPFYALFNEVFYDAGSIADLVPYYARIGFAGHYYTFIRRDSSLYRAFMGEIPLTPELFIHGVSPRMEHESSVLHQEQRADRDYLKNPQADRHKAGYDMGWRTEDLIKAIRKKDGEIPAYLVQRKRWVVVSKEVVEDPDYGNEVVEDVVNEAAVERLEGLRYGNVYKYKPGLRHKYGWTFKGILSDMHAFDDYYPENEVPAPIFPAKDEKIAVKDISWTNVRRANIVAIYRLLHYGNYQVSIPSPEVLHDHVPLENYLRTDLPEHYLFRQDPLGYMRLYKYTAKQIIGEVPSQLWRDLTGLRSYTELYQIRENVNPEVFIAVAKRLGIRHFPVGDVEFMEKNCRAINRVIQYLVKTLTGNDVVDAAEPSSSSARTGRSRRSGRDGDSKYDLIASQRETADIEHQDDVSIRAASPPPMVAAPAGPSMRMLSIPANFSLRPPV